MDDITFTPIGIIRTPFKSRMDMPIQSTGAMDVEGTIEVFDRYAEGLRDLDRFSHFQALYHFHRSAGYELTVVPFLDTVERGLFSTRAPRRPNGIGLSICELVSIDGNIIHFRGVDMLDETPLLDLKPLVPFFDLVESGMRLGWLEGKDRLSKSRKSDSRFK